MEIRWQTFTGLVQTRRRTSALPYHLAQTEERHQPYYSRRDLNQAYLRFLLAILIATAIRGLAHAGTSSGSHDWAIAAPVM